MANKDKKQTTGTCNIYVSDNSVRTQLTQTNVPDYRELFFKQKIWVFTQSFWGIKEYIKVYKGHIYINYQHKNEEYIDFIIEMGGFGFTREEVDSAIIEYLNKTEDEAEKED